MTATALPIDADAQIAAGVLLLALDDPRQWVDCVRSCLAIQGTDVVHIASSAPEVARKLYGGLSRVQVFEAWTLSEAIERVEAVSPELDAILVIDHPVAVSTAFLSNSLEKLTQDGRVATISFLSNAAGYLSFPHRNTAVSYGIGGMDEETVTQRLRELAPEPALVPIAMPAGSAVLIALSPYRLCGGDEIGRHSNIKLALAQIALRASRRGFSHLLDSSTYVMHPWLQSHAPVEAIDDELTRHSLHREFNEFPALYDQERGSIGSPMAIAMDVARAKVQGLRLLVDGSCLGAMEMGTQVQTVCLVDALARRKDVSAIAVGVPGGVVPGYASKLLKYGKVTFCAEDGLHFRGAPHVDIVHRPFQPDAAIPWGRWRELGKRVVITIQDLIAYKIGSYHRDGLAWMGYRENMKAAAATADGVVAISNDTLNVIEEEQLKVGPDRTCVAKNGSDHLDPDEAVSIPNAVIKAGLSSRRFVLVLGANYTHKNRDLAIKIWDALVQKGHDLALVMAGAQVPMGSSRLEEATLRLQTGGDLLSLPDVSSFERNWLMRHAALVLYPTSSEGFGLIPFEAASMGVPTVHVSFGPLKELIEDESIPRTWSVDELTEYAHQILIDPDRASQVVKAILRNAASLTWDDTAARLVDFYRIILSKVPR
ncbi:MULTISPECIES: glycosyltransferase [unclassified Pseudoxanthomonas]|uniref:glycosyltransferase n=1 Tax=unclassified Pseudoxanthomonas TaxID=2645906 RepID=UPI003076C201